MAKDYKYRAQAKRVRNGKKTENALYSIGFWKWMLITMLSIAFVVFLVYLKSITPKKPDIEHTTQQQSPLNSAKAGSSTIQKPAENTQTVPEHQAPRFDFYRLLPEKEVVVPDYEINTRTREERIGKTKEAHYIMQVGSFRSFKEADQLRAKLGLLGIESKVHKAKVENIAWFRVKIGPYSRMASVSAIKSRLRQNGIPVIVTETSE